MLKAMCVILPYKDKFIAMDLGQNIYSYFYNHQVSDTAIESIYQDAVVRYAGIHNEMINQN